VANIKKFNSSLPNESTNSSLLQETRKKKKR
jgi:hypothetical protein